MRRAISTLLLLCIIGLSVAAAEYFDMSEGDPGMETPCPPGDPRPGTWTEEDASSYPAPPEGPLEGKVLRSQFKVNACLATPKFFEVDEDAQFQLYVYLPEAIVGDRERTLLVWLVEEDDSSYLLAELNGTTEAKWHLVQADMPNEPGIIFPSLYKVEIWITDDVDFAAIRWFGVSSETLPPPETTDAPSTTEENTTSDSETTTEFDDTTVTTERG